MQKSPEKPRPSLFFVAEPISVASNEYSQLEALGVTAATHSQQHGCGRVELGCMENEACTNVPLAKARSKVNNPELVKLLRRWTAAAVDAAHSTQQAHTFRRAANGLASHDVIVRSQEGMFSSAR